MALEVVDTLSTKCSDWLRLHLSQKVKKKCMISHT